MALKAITTFMTFAALFVIAYFMGVAILDPVVPVVQSFDLLGFGSQVDSIHVAIVKYMVPVFLATIIIWAAIFILREERQTVR